jgi:SAM-dependent methyltransferase
MSVAEQYKRQYYWRDWQNVYCLLPDLNGKNVLDLGCAIGDQSYDFSKMGADVTGVDLDDGLLSVARERDIAKANFLKSDFTRLEHVLGNKTFDLIWSSFSIAYFVDQNAIFEYWAKFLNPGGFFVFVEMSDLLGHSAVQSIYGDEIAAFYEDALHDGRYDFCAGEKMKANIPEGFAFCEERILRDKELSADSVLPKNIQRAWAHRFDRMGHLKNVLGQEFIKEFLQDLNNENHISSCKVHAVIAQKTIKSQSSTF